jgi:hypothetical protein
MNTERAKIMEEPKFLVYRTFTELGRPQYPRLVAMFVHEHDADAWINTHDKPWDFDVFPISD